MRLGIKLNQAQTIGTESESLIKIQDAHYSNFTKIILAIFLTLFNLSFLIYLIFILLSLDTDSIGIQLEIFCWAMGTISSTLLLSTIIYTIVKLRQMWTGQENAEAKRITYIAAVFCIAFVTKSIYEWTEYSIYHNGKSVQVMVQL